jgi:hypothetical protein
MLQNLQRLAAHLLTKYELERVYQDHFVKGYTYYTQRCTGVQFVYGC